jgi:hypothetical protein
MLERIEQQNNEDENFEDIDSDDESMEDSDLAQRLEEVDLNDADAVWERLTDAEKEEFKSIVYNNEVDKIIQPVEAWWTQKLINLPVVDVEENEKELKKIQENCPKISENIQQFSKISPKPPAKCVVYNIASVVGVYTYIFRFYNGDHANYTLEAVNNFISICDNIKANVNYEEINAVIDAIVLNCHNQNLFADLSTKSLMRDDLKEIFEGPCEGSNYFLLAALSDIIELFESAKLKFKQETKRKSSKNPKKFSSEFPEDHENFENFKELKNQNHFNNCLRKLEFYLSFIKHCYNAREWPVEF